MAGSALSDGMMRGAWRWVVDMNVLVVLRRRLLLLLGPLAGALFLFVAKLVRLRRNWADFIVCVCVGRVSLQLTTLY